MTATYPARTDKAYRGVVYGIDVIDHVTKLEVPNDYVGKTRQKGRLRELQHRDRQPFADRIVGDVHVLWEGICTDEELAEMERRFIQDAEVRPRLNVEMNEDNRHRIPKFRQIEQRHERDRALGRPLWVPYEQRSRDSLLEWQTPDRPAYEQRSAGQRRVLKPWQKRLIAFARALALRASVWAGSTLVVWLLALHWHLGGWRQALTGAALFLPALLLTVLLIMSRTARKSTRRRFMRWLFAVRK